MNRLYRVIGYDAQDQCLFDETVEAPVKGIAEVMVLAQLYRNFATSPLVDRANRLVIRREDAGQAGSEESRMTAIDVPALDDGSKRCENVSRSFTSSGRITDETLKTVQPFAQRLGEDLRMQLGKRAKIEVVEVTNRRSGLRLVSTRRRVLPPAPLFLF